MDPTGKVMRFLIAISGPIAVGKSAFIAELLKRIKGIRISTRELILTLRDVPSERGPLQEAGDSLDRETGGRWVVDALSARAKAVEDDAIAIVDSVRIAKQIEYLRLAYGGKVKHIHLTASYDILSKRFMSRKQSGGPAVFEFATYDEARANATEADVGKLAGIADLLIETDHVSAEAAVTLAVQTLGILGNS
jgi:adenylosuccinate synthase